MLGPLDSKPFDIYISSFTTRAKADSDSRTIMDLSFPKGLSINEVLKITYLGTNFQKHYPSVDLIIQTLNNLILWLIFSKSILVKLSGIYG